VFWGGNAARWRRVAAATVAGAVVGLVGAAPALADDPVTAKPTAGKSYGHVRLADGDAVNVARLSLNFDGKNVLAYCIDLHHPVAIGKDYEEGSWDSSEVKNLGKVQWVLLHGYPQGDTAKLLTEAAAGTTGIASARVPELLYIATQVSIWHFSDGAVLTGRAKGIDDTEFAVVKSVYDYLTTHAGDAPEPLAELKISPATATAKAGGKAGPFTVTGPSGEITLTVEGGKAVDASGTTITTVTNGGTFWLTREGPGDVSVVAKAESTHSTGRVFLFKGKGQKQKLILAGTVGDKLTAGARATFTPQPETSTTPSPSASASPSGSASPSPSASGSAVPSVSPSVPGVGGGSPTLPKTGASTMLIVGAGVLLLLAGAVAVLIVRRRKVSFTA
jgi:TQXA domain-containing protein/LPXTG-motif cell wall-anchored protein